jgi:hypothetical protein
MGTDGGFLANQLLVQFGAGMGFVLVLVGRPAIRWPHWHGGAALLFLAAALLNPSWVHAQPDLLARRFTVRDAAARIASRPPANAVVIGRRSSSLLSHTPMRLGLFSLCSPGKDNAPVFAERVSQLLKTSPQGAVCWLVAGDEIPIYGSPDQTEVSSRFHMELVDTVFAPGDATPEPVTLHLLKLQNSGLIFRVELRTKS